MWFAVHLDTSHYERRQYAYSSLLSGKLPLGSLFHAIPKLYTNDTKIDLQP